MLLQLTTLVLGLAYVTGHHPSGTTIDEYQTFRMECQPNEAIKTRRVLYGKASRGCDPNTNKDINTALVAARCDNRRTCDVPAMNALFPDDCYNVVKEIKIDYECLPDIKSISGSENDLLSVKCSVGRIDILRAFYGTDILNCNSPSDSTSRVQKKCSGKKSCQIMASNQFFGDPCAGTPKRIDVTYTCYYEEK